MRTTLVSLFAAAALLSPLASASNVDPIFLQAQGRVILPNLKVGTATYYVMLKQIPGTLNFSVDTSTLMPLLPLTFTPAAASDLIGAFSPSFELTSTLTMNANGTYSLMQGPNDDPGCPAAGGLETGTYQYEPTTGVFTAVALTDANGSCGLSHPDGALRFKKDGTKLYIKIREDGMDMEAEMIKK